MADDLKTGNKSRSDSDDELEPDWTTQKGMLFYLFCAYFVQGIGSCITEALKVVLAYELDHCGDKRKVLGYLNQSNWGWSLKFIYAPLVDGFVLFGLRKYHRRSYIFCMSTLVSISLFLFSYYYDSLVPEGTCPNGSGLGAYLFAATFLLSIQDVALDGYSIIYFAGRNIGYASAIQAFGNVLGAYGGKTSILFLNESMKIPVSSSIAIIGFLFIIFAISVCFIKEKVPEGTPESISSSYFGIYKCLFNKNILFLVMLAATRGHFMVNWALGSTLDKTNRGITAMDFLNESVIVFPFSLLSMVLISRFISAKQNPFQKFLYGQLIALIATVLFYTFWFFAPFVDGDDPSQRRSDGIFTMWVLMDILIMPFTKIAEFCYLAYIYRVTPDRYAGGFVTFIFSVSNFAAQFGTSIEEALRTSFDAPMEIRCNYKNENFGKELTANGTERFCGTINCKTANPGISGNCNPWGDGYHILVLFGFVLFSLIILFQWRVLKPKLMNSKDKFDPDNIECRVTPVCCPRFFVPGIDTTKFVETGHSSGSEYVELKG